MQLLSECAALYRRADNPALLLKPLVNLSSVQMRLGNYDTAVAHLNEALPLAQQMGDLRGLTHIRNNLGANYLILGDLAAAYEQFAACLPLTAETAYQPVRLVVYQNLAEVSYKQGDWAQALAHCEASLSIAAEIGAAVLFLDISHGIIFNRIIQHLMSRCGFLWYFIAFLVHPKRVHVALALKKRG